jgi:hypothetical protein
MENVMNKEYDQLNDFIIRKYNMIKPKEFQDLFLKNSDRNIYIFSKIMAWNVEDVIINKNTMQSMIYNDVYINYSLLNFSNKKPMYFFTDGGHSQKRHYMSASIILDEDFCLNTIITGHSNPINKQKSMFHEKLAFILTKNYINKMGFCFNDMMWFTDLEFKYCYNFLKLNGYNDLVAFCNYKKDGNFANHFFIDGFCDSIVKSNSLKKFFCNEKKFVKKQNNYELTYNYKTKYKKELSFCTSSFKERV